MENVDGAIQAFISDPVLQKRLAKYLVQRCFRNSALEDPRARVTARVHSFLLGKFRVHLITRECPPNGPAGRKTLAWASQQ